MTQVHKETLDAIENAIPGRESVDVEIFGVEGIPEVELIAHKQRIISQFQQEETDRRNSTNGGGHHGGPTKKQKIEKLDPAEIKRRLAEHKAKLAESQNAAANGGVPAQPGLQPAVGGSQSPPNAPAAFSPGAIPPQQVQSPTQGFYVSFLILLAGSLPRFSTNCCFLRDNHHMHHFLTDSLQFSLVKLLSHKVSHRIRMDSMVTGIPQSHHRSMGHQLGPMATPHINKDIKLVHRVACHQVLLILILINILPILIKVASTRAHLHHYLRHHQTYHHDLPLRDFHQGQFSLVALHHSLLLLHPQ